MNAAANVCGNAGMPLVPDSGVRSPRLWGAARPAVMLFFVMLAMSASVSRAVVVAPSQVLVLYNAAWRSPLPGHAQESLAVARHYVRMHTDPVSGEKPYLLGLDCPALLPERLGDWRLGEGSGDNESGVVVRDAGSGALRDAGGLRDGRLVELILPEDGAPWDLQTLALELEPEAFPSRLALVRDGTSLHPDKVVVQRQGDWHVRALGSALVRGPFRAHARCRDAAGEMHEWTASYADFRDVLASTTGVDGVRDDQRYLDCVERPVKAFLEDPANARPDGTLLKDHILFLAVCYGLPRTVATPCGVATGITEQLRNFGSEIDFGQRLQIMYYDLDSTLGVKVSSMRFASGRKAGGFSDYLFRSALAKPLSGPGINPFLHPDAYRKGKAGSGAGPLPFTGASRRADPRRHLFFAMRIDGPDASSAMELVDRAVYASTFAGPEMGIPQDGVLKEDPQRTGGIGPGTPARPFWERGYRHMYQHPRGWTRLELFRLAPGLDFFNESDVFLPGGVAAFVQSNQGWNRADSRFMDFLNRGVTVTAGAARVAPGKAPHIHNRSFWDEAVLYPYLLDGYAIGEVLLMNQVHLGWITSFVGDPLYVLPRHPRSPGSFPALSWESDVTVERRRDPALGEGVLVTADLRSSPKEPRVAQMRLVGEKDPARWRHVFGRFSSRPNVFVPMDEVRAAGSWRLELIDPFGRRAELGGSLEAGIAD